VSDRLSELEAKVAALASEVRRLDERLSNFERGPVSALELAPAPEEGSPWPDTADFARALALGGRTFLVLAGAFVLRAVTEAAVVPSGLGVVLGLVFGGTWLAMADRAGRGGQRLSAVVHGLAAAIIGFPLLFEATTRFHLFSPTVAGLGLAALSAAALGVAAHRSLHALAWVVLAAGLLTAPALALATGRLVPAALYLVALGVATLWLGYAKGWTFLPWPVALVADLFVFVLTFRAVGERATETVGAALLTAAALLLGYLGSVVVHTLILERGVLALEFAASALAMLAGVGGALILVARTGVAAAGTGLGFLACGLLAYAVAMGWVLRRERIGARFHLYASLALGFTLAGSALLLSGPPLVVSWLGLALLLAVIARLRLRVLALHAAVFALAAAGVSGLLAEATATVAGREAAGAALHAPASVLVLATLALVTSITAGTTARPRLAERVPQALLLTALLVAAAGLAMSALLPAVAGEDAAASAGRVATARTAVLVGGVLALAALGRTGAFLEARWLVYPWLAAVGLKILLEDLPRGRPATLVLTFALFGTALIAVSRLRRRPAPEAGQG